ncbi:hypothetical protein [Natronolimnohabitans innermongolicus]|uniref:ABC-2 type transport system permease protein n=1 Tax=Natronolimnohabitans innermongolicus JCM 12255 TaxID=1227499 RepID=L9WU55_9EURY|nr:hypothetical protein [Natronolimnohabitans innermongolicus]ELY52952.1 hypothetical protein C493_15183 [Natronolimnohabitans innermongolicus JCM 12255]
MTRIPLLVARTEFRRTIRSVSDERTKLLMMALLALFMGGSIMLAGGYLLPTLGSEVAAGVTPDEATLATEFVTGGVALGWVFLTFMAAIRTFSAAADPDKPAFLLTSTKLRNVVVGVVAAEIAMFAVWVLPPAIVLAGAFAYGAGTAVPLAVAPLVVGLVLVTAVPVGFVLGTWVRHLVTVYEPIARYRYVIFAGFWLAYFGAIGTGHFNLLTSGLFTTLQDSPLGWLGHLVLAGVPNVAASTLPLVGAFVGAAVLTTAAFAAGVVSARVHWFADPARFDESESSQTDRSNRLGTALSYGLSRPIQTVTLTAIRRTKRAPIRLVYVAYPLLGSIFFLQEIVQTGTVPSYVAVALSLYVVWGAGALFTLNPLGDLGRALPAVVASPLTGRQAIAGLVIAGSVVAAPIALVASLALGLASPLSVEQTAALVAATTVGAVVTPALATGVGTAAPRFGSVSISSNREAIMPSKTAFIVYSIGIIFPAIAALVLYTDSPDLLADLFAAVAAWLPGPETAPSAREITIAAWTVLVVGLIAPVVSYLYAVERFDWYTRD